MSGLRAAGEFVPLEAVLWLPEAQDHATPEALLIEAQEAAETEREGRRLAMIFPRLPKREALALASLEGLFGCRRLRLAELAALLGLRGPAEVDAFVRQARARVVEELARDNASPEVETP
jgi:hypothetical protein